jgi:apolipoprotein N-acyltransferase
MIRWLQLLIAHVVFPENRWRWVCTFLLGAMTTLAFPPYHIVILLVPALSLLLHYVHTVATTRKQALAFGWWFGWGHFMFTLYWFAHSLALDLNQFGWMIPFAVGGMPAVLAVYTGLVCIVYWQLRHRYGLQGSIVFAVVWTAIEWLRGQLFTGFPWNLMGYAWSGSLPMQQVTSVIGTYGLSILTIWWSSLPGMLLWPQDHCRYTSRVLIGVALVSMVSLSGWGYWRLQHTLPVPLTGITLRIVQGNWEPYMYASRAGLEMRLQKELQLSALPWVDPEHPLQLIIWPECGIPYPVMATQQPLRRLQHVIPKGGYLLSGGQRVAPNNPYQRWNTLLAIDHDGQIISYYDKVHRVPFGEYIPLRKWLPLTTLTTGSIDLLEGEQRQPLTIGAHLPPVLPLICYEAVFPDELGPVGKARWILNITNDGWFAESIGPHQHFHMARMRAIEQGLPLVRAAVTGISAVIDPYGRILHYLPLGEEGIIDAVLPSPLAVPTPYQRYGNITWLLLAAMLVILNIGTQRLPQRIIKIA